MISGSSTEQYGRSPGPTREEPRLISQPANKGYREYISIISGAFFRRVCCTYRNRAFAPNVGKECGGGYLLSLYKQ